MGSKGGGRVLVRQLSQAGRSCQDRDGGRAEGRGCRSVDGDPGKRVVWMRERSKGGKGKK
jgi:hypothetical protein